MKLVPITTPNVQQPGNATAVPSLTSRERAIQAFEKSAAEQTAARAPQQAEQPIVRNANQVSPEELSAIRVPTKTVETRQPNTTEAPTSEAPKEETTGRTEESISSQYATLARKEKALRAKAVAQERAAKAREDSFKAQEAAFKAKEAEYQSQYIPKERLASDTLTALTDAGVSYDKITELLLNQPNPEQMARDSQLAALNNKIKQLEEAQTKANKSAEDRDIQARQQAVSQIRNDVMSLVRTDPSFETIKETNSVGEVVELIERTFDEDGILLTVEEAARAVEDEVADRLYRYTSRIKKVRNRLQPAAQGTRPAQKQSASSSNNQLKTLTNSVSSTRQLSARERAILAFKGELKNS